MTRELSERCVKGYNEFRSPGKLMTNIYADTMNKVFGCVTITGRFGAKEFYHPQDKPFPSLRQFQYEVEKAIGIEAIQLNRYGAARHRRSLAPSQGRFSEHVAYLLEEVEFDAYFTEERPRGYILDVNIRHVWVEVDHQIILLDAQLPIRDDPELLFVSIAELRDWESARRKVGSAFRGHKAAAYAESRRQFEKETGKGWDSGIRKPGRAKKTAAARQETREAEQHTSKRKSAP
jgi:hypothetical protein